MFLTVTAVTVNTITSIHLSLQTHEVSFCPKLQQVFQRHQTITECTHISHSHRGGN